MKQSTRTAANFETEMETDMNSSGGSPLLRKRPKPQRRSLNQLTSLFQGYLNAAILLLARFRSFAAERNGRVHESSAPSRDVARE